MSGKEKILRNVTELIGRTPMVEVIGYARSHDAKARIVAKVESFNPGGSVKDRVALSMIADAEEKGLLASGATIIEPTSGNTGIGLAMVAAVKGYKLILTMPETMSEERRRLLAAYGAQLVLTPGEQGMQGAVDRAEELHASIPGSVILGQFDNPANPLAHQLTTGEEIWEDANGEIDIFVACVGSGGTVSGAGKALKLHDPNVKIVAVEPAESPLLSEGKAGRHGIQGIGANFIPANYNGEVVDEVMTVTTDEAVLAARDVARTDGLLVGISSGAALAVAARMACLPENQGKLIVVLLPDSGERYLSVM